MIEVDILMITYIDDLLGFAFQTMISSFDLII